MTEKETGDFKCPSCGVPLNVLISKEAYEKKPEQTATIKTTVEDVKTLLPQDILPDLNVAVNKQDSKTIHIVPKKYLGKENFYKVSKAVQNMHGEWVSKGKHSYWWIPTTQEAEV